MRLFLKILQCFYGKVLWHNLINKTSIKNVAVILIPDVLVSNEEKYIYQYMQAFIEKNQYEGVILVTSESHIPPDATDSIVMICTWPLRKLNALIQYYLLFPFDSRFVIASINYPEGRNGKLLIRQGFTEEEVFLTGIYGLYYERNKDE